MANPLATRFSHVGFHTRVEARRETPTPGLVEKQT